ncbi:MAG: acetate--CoA ligase family protein [Candidatus Micrarchaeota archaeon]|nr:acetate--CoA ligase family protein [Candidatus Micrarchaeota archaeon]
MELLDYSRANGLLTRYGIKSVKSEYVKSAKEALTFSKGSPIVLKALTDKALHKTKSGLIILNLATEKEISDAFSALSKRAEKFRPYRILAQKMASNGIEIIIGGKTDQQFGKMILIGLGGIYVETFKDVAMRTCPITKHDAESMLHQLKSSKVIAPDQKTESMVADLILKTSRLFYDSRLTELDLNPIILHDGTYDAVDLRLIQ